MAGFDMIVSDCSQSVRRNGAVIQIRIYRLEHERDWSVEIVEGEDLSTFSDATYSSERAALQAALRTLKCAECGYRLPEGEVSGPATL